MSEHFSVLSFQLKIQILNEFRDNLHLKPNDMAKRYNVHITQIMNLIERKDEILLMNASAWYQNALEMPLKTGKYPKMENILYQWYIAQPKEIKIINSALIDKAKQIITIINEPFVDNFRASSTWLNGFKRRFNIDQNKINLKQSIVLNEHQHQHVPMTVINGLQNIQVSVSSLLYHYFLKL